MPVGLNLVALGGNERSVNSLYVEAKSIIVFANNIPYTGVIVGYKLSIE
jgi:hypothetical protein